MEFASYVTVLNPVPSRHIFRYHACLMRNRFDKNKDIKDMRLAHELVLAGEQELFDNTHYQPKKCKQWNDPGRFLF